MSGYFCFLVLILCSLANFFSVSNWFFQALAHKGKFETDQLLAPIYKDWANGEMRFTK